MLTTKPLVDLARQASRSIFRTAFYSPHWRIGWRFVEAGDDVWSRGDLGGRPWRVLRNKPFRFFADPFPIACNGKTWLFFEDFDHRIGKGRISAVAFGPRGPEGDVFPVLEQPWHLSFPFVFEHEGELWMLPESSNNRTVSLYRAENFPTRWVKETDLLVGVEASDSTIVSFEGRLWMFTTVQHDDPSRSNKLLLLSRAIIAWTLVTAFRKSGSYRQQIGPISGRDHHSKWRALARRPGLRTPLRCICGISRSDTARRRPFRTKSTRGSSSGLALAGMALSHS